MNKRQIILLCALALVLFITAISIALSSCQKAPSNESFVAAKLDALLRLKNTYSRDNNIVKEKWILKKIVQEYPGDKNITGYQRELEDINMKLLFSPLVGEEGLIYEVRPQDTLGGIAKKFNTTVDLIKASNNIKSDIIVPNQRLKVWKGRFSILVDISQNTLMLKSDGDVLKRYTVSTGSNNSTPRGIFKIEEKLISPQWYKVGAVISPDNPEYELGTRWMGLSIPRYGIHGTHDESTIGSHATKGCVRMTNRDVEEIFVIVPSGTEVEIID